ncbi:MAG: PIN domain-containing protein [Calditrichae bacterium]|nr:PIN domain-containing protein [Calditrichia bacterium]
MYLLDSDILIYSLKNLPMVRQRFTEKASIPKAISVITYGELYYCAKKSAQVEKNLAIVRRISELFSIINTTKSIMETFADLKTDLHIKGKIIPDFDLIIAATALSFNYILVTNNDKHFSRIPSLQIENWTK